MMSLNLIASQREVVESDGAVSEGPGQHPDDVGELKPDLLVELNQLLQD